MKIAVLGAGGWGTTLAILLHYNGHAVELWEYDKGYYKSLVKTRENKIFLPGIRIPEEILITHQINSATEDKNLILLAIPSQFLRGVIREIHFSNLKNALIINVAKGIEKDSLMTMSQVIMDEKEDLSEDQIGTLSGPSHAEEVSKMIPTAIVAASVSAETAKSIQAAFMNSYFRVYSSKDLLGVELGGSLKNVIAIGAGIVDGANFGDNTKAAIMTRGIAEIMRLGVAMGSRPETFSGLSGMGDLIVTCMSRHSRNRYVGEKIGGGMKLKSILKTMTMIAEGVETSKSVYRLAEKYKIETPISLEVYKVLFEDKDPVKATYDLMTRDMKSEH